MLTISRIPHDRHISPPVIWNHTVTYALNSADSRNYVSIRLCLSATTFTDRGRMRMGVEMYTGVRNEAGIVRTMPSISRVCFGEVSAYAIEQYLKILRSGGSDEEMLRRLTVHVVNHIDFMESWPEPKPKRARLPIIRFINDGTVLETTDGPTARDVPGQYPLDGVEVNIAHQGDLWPDIFGTLRDWTEYNWINPDNGTVKNFQALRDAGISTEGYLPEEIRSHFSGWYLGEAVDPNDPHDPIYDLFYMYYMPTNVESGARVAYIHQGRIHDTTLSRWLKHTAYSEVYRLTGACIRTPIRPIEAEEKADV